jgi:uncharacterized protein (TIGR03083 family)
MAAPSTDARTERAHRTREAYQRVRERTCALLAAVTEQDLARPVPACPGWTVHDVFAHAVGVAADIVTGRLEQVGSPTWTAAQVAARQTATAAELAAEWRATEQALVPVFGTLPGAQITMDALTHELDLRAVLGHAERPEDDDLRVGLGFLAKGLGSTLTHRFTLPAIQVETPIGEWTVGEGQPGVGVRADAIDALRSLSGRRTIEQIRRLDWDDDPERWLPAFTYAVFTPPVSPVEPGPGGS